MQFPKALQLISQIHMESAIWFIALAVLSVLLLVITFWKKKDMKLGALKMSTGGLAAFFENVIFIWLKSYDYNPGILKIRYYDNLLGAYLSQVFYVSSVAVFIAAFNLGFGWMLVFAVMFMGIEYLFLALGIYHLHWWHPSFTGLGLLIYFWLSKKWYSIMLQASSSFLRFFSLICMNYVIYANLNVIPILTGHYKYVVGWFQSIERDTAFVIVIYCTVRGLITAIVCFFRLHWGYKAFVLILMSASNLILIYQKIFIYKHLWELAFLPIIDFAVLILCDYFNRVLSTVRK
jgi:hypothetical protein